MASSEVKPSARRLSHVFVTQVKNLEAGNQLADDLDGSLPRKLLDALDPALVGGDRHLLRLEDNRVLALLFKVKHHFAGTWRGVGCGADRDKHLFGSAVAADADANAGGYLDLHRIERLDGDDGELGRGVFFTHERAADEHGCFYFELLGQPLVIAAEGDELDLGG